MSNAAPAIVTTSLPTGPGQALSSVKFTDVNELNIDFLRNQLKIVRAGSGGTIYNSYAAATTVTITISGVQTTVTVS